VKCSFLREIFTKQIRKDRVLFVQRGDRRCDGGLSEDERGSEGCARIKRGKRLDGRRRPYLLNSQEEGIDHCALDPLRPR